MLSATEQRDSIYLHIYLSKKICTRESSTGPRFRIDLGNRSVNEGGWKMDGWDISMIMSEKDSHAAHADNRCRSGFRVTLEGGRRGWSR